MPSLTKVCFIVPPNPTALEDRIDPHLGMLCMASVVREKGYEVEYVEWDGRVPEADVYGITSYGVNYGIAVAIAASCKSCFPESKTIFGGPVATFLPQRCLEDFDAVCIGEGEAAILEFLEKRETNRFYFGAYSIYELGYSPPPAYDLVDWGKYSRLVMGERAFELMTSRGCPYNCAFCCNDRRWNRFRKQPLQTVLRDIRYGKSVTGFSSAQFWDSSLEERVDSAFLEALGRENITFFYQARGSDHGWDKEIYQAGGRVAFIGLETADPDGLKKMRKGLTPDEIKRAIHKSQDAGISVRCGLLFGFPGETPSTLATTRRFVEEMNVDQVFLSFFVPFPGSDVWQNPAKYGVTWMAPWYKQRIQDKRGWVEASIETPWMSRNAWNAQAQEMAAWWKALPRRTEADPSWGRKWTT